MIPLKKKEYLKLSKTWSSSGQCYEHYKNAIKYKIWGSPCSFLCNLDGYYSKWMTQEVYIRNASNQKRELSFLEKLISCIKISKQFNKIYINLTATNYFH